MLLYVIPKSLRTHTANRDYYCYHYHHHHHHPSPSTRHHHNKHVLLRPLGGSWSTTWAHPASPRHQQLVIIIVVGVAFAVVIILLDTLDFAVALFVTTVVVVIVIMIIIMTTITFLVFSFSCRRCCSPVIRVGREIANNEDVVMPLHVGSDEGDEAVVCIFAVRPLEVPRFVVPGVESFVVFVHRKQIADPKTQLRAHILLSLVPIQRPERIGNQLIKR